MKMIYSDIRGELVTTSTGTRVQIYDGHSKPYSPALVLPDKLAVKKMRDFLSEILEELEKGEKIEK